MRFITTGVRRAESRKRMSRGIYETLHSDRKKEIILNNDNDNRRRLFEVCALKAKRVCNLIIDWTDADAATVGKQTAHGKAAQPGLMYSTGGWRMAYYRAISILTTLRDFMDEDEE